MKTYCEASHRKKSHFDPRSFRWKTSGKAKLLIGCRRGQWNERSERCEVGTEVYKLLVPAKGRCDRGERKIKKG